MATVLLHYRLIICPVQTCLCPKPPRVFERALRVPKAWLPAQESQHILRTFARFDTRGLGREEFAQVRQHEDKQLHDPTGFQQRFFQRRFKAMCEGFEHDERGPRCLDALNSYLYLNLECWMFEHPSEMFDIAAYRNEIRMSEEQGILDDELEDDEDEIFGEAPFSVYFAPCGSEVLPFDPELQFDASFTVVVHHSSIIE